MTTRKDADRLLQASQLLTVQAAADLAAVFARISGGDPAVMRDALLEVMPKLVDKYGDLAARESATWYEEMRRRSVAGRYSARLAPQTPLGQVSSSTRYATGKLFGSKADPDLVLERLQSTLQRQIFNQTRTTVQLSAHHDPSRPRWARVPSGAKTCAWCTMLASRGFVYLDLESAGGEGDEFHDECDCLILPGWGDDPRVEGYDPEAMYAKYQAARADIVADDLNPSDKLIAARMRDMFPDEFTDSAVVRHPARPATGVPPRGALRVRWQVASHSPTPRSGGNCA